MFNTVAGIGLFGIQDNYSIRQSSGLVAIPTMCII